MESWSDSSIIVLDDDSPEPPPNIIRRSYKRNKSPPVTIDLTSPSTGDHNVISVAARKMPVSSIIEPIQLDNDDEVKIVHQNQSRVRGFKRRRVENSQEFDEVSIIDENDAKPSATATATAKSAARTSATAPSRSSSSTKSTSDSDVQLLSVAVKLTPRQSAMQQIQEIFPDMLPSHITSHLDEAEPITSQSIEILIQKFLSETSYPKIQTRTAKREEKKAVDYANDEYEQSIQYKYQANDRLLQAFPFMSKQGIQRLLAKYNGRYHKTYIHIVDIMKKLKNFENDVQRYDEFIRLMSGGRLKSTEDRSTFSLELNGIKYETTLKIPKKNRGVIPLTDKVLLDEIAFTKRMIRSWGKAVQMERNRLVARKKAEESGATIECTCCYGDYASMEMVTCNDGHIFCMDCLRRYTEEKVFGNGDLGKEGSTELCCMDMSGCQSFFSRDQLSKSLSAKVMKKYDELQTTLVLEKAGLNDICKCPKCDFQASLAESEKVFQCPSCAYESCRMCGEESHIPLRCEEVEKKTETSARLQIEEAMTQARIRHCPNGCKQGFYKVEGCNKMTCPTCKTFICYVCRAEIKKNVGYAHFCQTPHCQHKRCNGCPLYSNAEEDDGRASREAGLKTAQELKGDSRTENVAEKMESILHEEEQQTSAHGRRVQQNARAQAGVDPVQQAVDRAVANQQRMREWAAQLAVARDGAERVQQAVNRAVANRDAGRIRRQRR